MEEPNPLSDDALYDKGLAPAPQPSMKWNSDADKPFRSAIEQQIEVWKKNAYHEQLQEFPSHRIDGDPITDPVLFDADWCHILRTPQIKELGVNECLKRFREKRAEVERMIAHAAKMAEFEAKGEETGKQVLGVTVHRGEPEHLDICSDPIRAWSRAESEEQDV